MRRWAIVTVGVVLTGCGSASDALTHVSTQLRAAERKARESAERELRQEARAGRARRVELQAEHGRELTYDRAYDAARARAHREIEATRTTATPGRGDEDLERSIRETQAHESPKERRHEEAKQREAEETARIVQLEEGKATEGRR